MRLVASPEAVKLVQARGGKLFVRASRVRGCCGGPTTFLKASTEPEHRAFRQVADGEIELYFEERLRRLPDELRCRPELCDRPRVDVRLGFFSSGGLKISSKSA